MPNDLLDDYRRRLLERYRLQPAVYQDRLRGQDGASVRAAIKPGEWSAHQLVFHVCAVDEQAYGPRLLRILRDDRPKLEDFDEVAWMTDHYDPGEAPEAILERWGVARQTLADTLQTASLEAWNRAGMHAFHGERTLQWWLERGVAHGEDHLRQLDGE